LSQTKRPWKGSADELTDPAPSSDGPQRLGVEEIELLLCTGALSLEGLVPWSSNYTFLATITRHDQDCSAVYKPTRGERPLWDFATGSLCHREIAAYRLSRSLGWPSIPPVVLRDGPHGPGSVQLFVDADPDEHYLSLRASAENAQVIAFALIALFDCFCNNADRKSGHVLKGTDGTIWAIDHGLTFHVEHKLRTVIWDFAGQAIPDAILADLGNALVNLSSQDTELRHGLSAHLSVAEIDALVCRLRKLVESERFPSPAKDWRNYPYPLV